MNEYAHPEVIIDTQWLVNHLDDPNVRVVEVDIDQQQYNQGHIPGAVFWNILNDLLLPSKRINFATNALEKVLGRSGITHDTTVIAYGTTAATGAWLFWLLKAMGHDNVLVLNGGRRKWLLENCPMTSEQTIVTPTDYQVKVPDVSLRAFYEDVYNAISRADCVLLDVRTHQEYSGQWYFNQPPSENERAGHIPSAVHIDYELALNEDETFKSFDQLQALYRSKGITQSLDVIPYCAVGGRSAHTWFVLKYLLGFNKVRNYDGSWNEWSQLLEAPIE